MVNEGLEYKGANVPLVGTILLQLKEQHNYCDRQTLKNGVTSFSLPARKDHIQRQFCLIIRSYLASHVE